MKLLKYILVAGVLSQTACSKTIDLYPESYLSTGTYYSSFAEYNGALAGIYNAMQRPMLYEWQLTELRSDNSKQGVPGSTSSTNRELSDLDMFVPSTSHAAIYNYWLASYNNIRNTNIILQKLGASYDATAGEIQFNASTFPFSETERKQLAGEALFIRAYHYFNLVRLFGGTFLVTEPLAPEAAKALRRSTLAETYKLIEADLIAAAASMSQAKRTAMTSGNVGKATTWAAKGLLGKVYLTQGKKAEAKQVLTDVKDNSGHALVTGTNAYANVFSVGNEMNSEIIFAVRYKGPGIGLGSPFANFFGPLQTGNQVVLGDGDGLNYPTADLDTASTGDLRKPVILAQFGTGTSAKLYTPKYLSTLTVQEDGDNDWPILRYADILLMIAEADGYSPSSIQLINTVRQRAGNAAIDPTTINSVAAFEQLLSNERRIEFAFENHRWFDLVRYNTTMTTITAEQTMKAHFADEYERHYKQYTAPAIPLATLQGNVTAQKLLLPIPQREFDTNTALPLTEQNPGY